MDGRKYWVVHDSPLGGGTRPYSRQSLPPADALARLKVARQDTDRCYYLLPDDAAAYPRQLREIREDLKRDEDDGIPF